MNTKDTKNENICCLYANEMHLEMMILPYINNKLEKKEKIYLINEIDLVDTVEKVLERINLKEEKKNEMLNLKWNNDNKKEIEKIRKENEKSTIIIDGGKSFNEKIEKQIQRNNNFEIINCYNLEKIGDIETIKSKYTKILNSSGIKELI